MAEKKFIIEVRTKGFARATRDFKQLNTDGKKFEQTTDRMRRSTRGLERSLGGIRNRLLVNAFAVAAVTKAFGVFFRTAIQFEDVKTRLVGLTGSIENAEFAFEKFNAVASSTPFQLNDVVNAGAQLQAFGAVAVDTIKPITDLAAFMGTTATEAANAFGRAFAGGAGSADILREKGVLNIIKSFKGIEDLSKITLPEFREALIGALVDPSVGIEGSAERMSKTFSGAISNMMDSVSRLTAVFGDKLLPTLTSVIIKITEISDKAIQIFGPEAISNFDNFGKKLSVVSTELSMMSAQHLPVLRERLAEAEKESAKFEANLLKQQKAANENSNIFSGAYTLALDTSTNSQKNASKMAEDGTITLKELSSAQTDLTGKFITITPVIDNMVKAVEQETTVVAESSNTTNRAAEIVVMLKEKIAELELQEKNRIAALAEANAAEEKRNTIIKAQQELLALQAEAEREKNAMISQFTSAFSATDEGQRKNIQNTIDMIMSNRDLLSNFGDVDITLDHLKQKLADVGTQQKQFAESANIAAGAINMTTSAVRALSSESTSTEAKMQALLGILASFIGMVGGPTGMVAGAGLNLFGALAFGHTGGLIKNNGIQKFATGGMVRGQDNVPIMAQAGEFIMQRSAVDNIGIQNLANLNNGTSGVGNNITVNISAPLVDDTVVDHIIPAIEKASRFDRA
tara:strand:- start:4272 stop:6335 length:2064 start_codon:yes stop_codon:yes gene_type:complete